MESMKNVLLLIALAVFATGMIHGGTITVTQPGGGNVTMGSVCQIRWTASNVSSKVKIQLIKPGGALVGTILANLPADSSPYYWTVAAPAAVGEQYRIRVRSIEGPAEGASDIFHVQDREIFRINITSPSGGERFKVPGNFSVRWNVEGGNLVENINLIVKKGGQVLSTKLIDNTGVFDTTLPGAISEGNDYTIRLEDADDASHFAESKNFEIYHSGSPGINVSKPCQYSVFSGETMKIQWECWGFDKEVNVELLMGGNPAGFLCRNLKDGYFNWKVNRPVGALSHHHYQIRISSTGNSGISGRSNGFYILSPSDLLVYSKGIFEKENFMKGEMTNLRFIVKDPSEGRASIQVEIAIDFIRGHIKNPREISMNKVYALANTKYTGNKIAFVNPGTTTAFELPVTISDQPGEYTVKITVLPTIPNDPRPGNNTIYGYYKVVLVPLKILK